MSKAESKNILDEIAKCHGYDVAIFTTFNFEIDYFDKFVVSKLISNGVRSINVFVDAKQLNESIKNNKSNLFGKQYFVSPINIESAFHPKIILFLAKEKAKLFVASANVRMSGYAINNEVFDYFEYDSKKPENCSLITDAIDFIKSLNKLTKYEDKFISDYINSIEYKSNTKNDEVKVLHSLSNNVIEQVKSSINEQIIKINIAVPFYDDKLIALKSLSKFFKCSDIGLYIQNKTNSFPIIFNKENKVVNSKNIKVFEKIISNDNNNFYHGKAIQFKTKTNDYILFGSSNCTQSALTKSHIEKGNIEFNILKKGNKNQFDYYFKNFSCDKKIELESDLKNYGEVAKLTNFVFLHGLKDKNEIKLFFKFKNKIDDLSIKSNDILGHFEYIDEYMVIKFNGEDFLNINSFINVEVENKKTRESFICWFVDYDYLYQFRVLSSDYKLVDYKVNDGLDKYMQYIMNISNIILANIEHINIIKVSEEETIEEEIEAEELEEEVLEDDGIIHDEIKDDYPKDNSINIVLGRASALANRYFYSITHNNKKASQEYKYDSRKTRESTRTPTTDEERFGRRIKKIINEYLIGEGAEKFSCDNYKKIFGAIFDVIQQFVYIEQLDGFLEKQYVINTKIKVAKLFINKILQSPDYKVSNDDLLFMLKVMIESCGMSSLSNIKIEQEYIMYELDQNFDIKKNLKQLLMQIDVSDISDTHICGIEYFDLIDNLLDYLDDTQLSEYFTKAYNSKPKIEITGKTINIQVVTNKVQSSIAVKHLQEIAKYIKGNKINVHKCIIVFVSQLENNEIVYTAEFAGNHINLVNQIRGKICKRCKLTNNVYRPEFFND